MAGLPLLKVSVAGGGRGSVCVCVCTCICACLGWGAGVISGRKHYRGQVKQFLLFYVSTKAQAKDALKLRAPYFAHVLFPVKSHKTTNPSTKCGWVSGC